MVTRAVMFHGALAERLGINLTGATCLNALRLLGPKTPGELAEITGLTTGGAVTNMIDRLERAGYVRRRRDPADRRRVFVELNPELIGRDGEFDPLGPALQDLYGQYGEADLGVICDFAAKNNQIIQQEIHRIRDTHPTRGRRPPRTPPQSSLAQGGLPPGS